MRVTDPNVNDPLLVGVQYPASERIFFAKGTVTPQRKGSPILPQDLELHEIEGVYWDRVPSSGGAKSNGRRGGPGSSYFFSTKFLVSPLFNATGKVELYPGACLTHPSGVYYCCQTAPVKVSPWLRYG